MSSMDAFGIFQTSMFPQDGRSKTNVFHIYGARAIIALMKKEAVRTTVDIPAPLYRKLKEQAAAQGRSVRELILVGVRAAVLQSKQAKPRRVKFPLLVSTGPKIELTNEQIYELVEFP